MRDRDEQLVWYAAYGSNLSTTRFRCYLEGGLPLGATRPYDACAHGDRYLDTRPIELDRRLRFGRSSLTWDRGGVAFVDHEPAPAHRSYGRAYLLGLEQLVHVAHQENRLEHALELIDRQLLARQTPTVLEMPATKYYNVLLPLGELDGVPLVTLTGPAGDVPPNHPSPAYRATIVRGLRETWPGLTNVEIDDYLTAAGAPTPSTPQP